MVATDPAAAGTLRQVLAEARPVAQAFVAAGHRVFLVGGMVRDLHLGRVDLDDLDLDLTTDATPDRIKAIVGPLADALWTQGERFGTIGARIDGRVYEITTHRSEVYVRGSRKPEVRFSTALAEDLSRRDFTVNAMAVELPGGDIVDPFHGAVDLGAGVLRTPLDPRVSFDDDPLRMLRAARFLAGYGLVPDTDLVAAMTEMAARIEIVSAERIRDELDKLLSAPAPAAGLALLAETGVLHRAVPWAADTEAARVAVDALEPSPLLRLAVLTADADTATVRARLHALRHSRDRTDRTAAVIAGARTLSTGDVDTPAAFRRWWLDIGGDATDVRRLATVLDPDGERHVRRSIELEQALAAELADLGPPLDAATVMAELGIDPGPDVGAALAHLAALRLERGPIDPTEARSLVRDWWAGRVT